MSEVIKILERVFVKNTHLFLTLFSTLFLLSFNLFAELAPVGTQAPTFALPTLTSNRVYLTTWAAPKLKKPYFNKIKHTVIVAFWATYCAPCQQEIPQLEAYIESRTKAPIKLFLVNVENMTNPKLTSFVKDKGWSSPVLHDPYMRAAKNYGVEALPALFVIDKNGKIIYANSGFDPSHGSISDVLDEVIFLPKKKFPVKAPNKEPNKVDSETGASPKK